MDVLRVAVLEALLSRGVSNARGEPRRLLTEYRQITQAQLAFDKELGMTPAARMTIKANGTRWAFDLPSAMSAAEEAETVPPGESS